MQGYGSFLLRDLPFDALQFCVYEQLRIGYKLAVSFCCYNEKWKNICFCRLMTVSIQMFRTGEKRSKWSRECNAWCFCWCCHWSFDHSSWRYQNQINGSGVSKRWIHKMLKENMFFIDSFHRRVRSSSNIVPIFCIEFWQGAGTQYKGVADCIKTIIREEGSSALWKVNQISALTILFQEYTVAHIRAKLLTVWEFVYREWVQGYCG